MTATTIKTASAPAPACARDSTSPECLASLAPIAKTLVTTEKKVDLSILTPLENLSLGMMAGVW